MGYTTEFYGHFTLNRPIEEVAELKGRENNERRNLSADDSRSC
jgi:hypothetical protein